MIECEDCGGTGIDPGGLSAYERTDCPTCGGSGLVESEEPIAAGAWGDE